MMKKYLYILAGMVLFLLPCCSDLNDFEVQDPDKWDCEFKTLPPIAATDNTYGIYLLGETERDLPIKQMFFLLCKSPDFSEDVITIENSVDYKDGKLRHYIDKRQYVGTWYYKLARKVGHEWTGSDNTESFSVDASLKVMESENVTDTEIRLTARFESPYKNYDDFEFQISTTSSFESYNNESYQRVDRSGNSVEFISYATDLKPSTTYYIRSILTLNGQEVRSNVIEIKTTATPYNRPTSGILNGHEYVNLGLPSGTLWASCNLDADSPKDFGGYYGWGCLEPLSGDGLEPDRGTLPLANDAAREKWGATWHIPSKSDFEELIKYCDYCWEMNGGVYGYKLTGPNGQSIFLPAAGGCYYLSDTQENVGKYGYYRVNESYESVYQWEGRYYYDYYQQYFSFSKSVTIFGINYNGVSIRPVAR